MNLTVAPCSGGTDFFGNSCSCCMNAHGTMDFAICAESNPLFSSNKFATYAKSKTNYKENLKLLAFILLAVIFAFIL